MATSRSGPRRLSMATGAFVMLVCVAILVLSGLREWSSRAADLRNAEVETSNLARSLAQYADDTFELADNFLISTVNSIEMDGADPVGLWRLRKLVDQRKAYLGRIRGLFVYDSAGLWLATSEPVDFSGLNNSDRDYFQLHRNSPDRGTHLGKPIQSRSGGQWIITASRRYDNPDGSFAGVVLATVDVAHFSGFFGKFDVGPNGSISMMSTAGIMLARSPADDAYVGRDMSSSELLKSLPARPLEGVYYFKSPLDARDRLSSYSVSTKYPLLILATLATSDVLAQWKHEASSRMILVGILTSLIGVIGFYLVRQLLSRQRFATALLAKEADFRLLAEESSDMVMRIGLDGQIAYVSPSCARILGWSAQSLQGTPALGGIDPEDLPRVELTVADLKRGVLDDTKIVYRTRHRDNRQIWLETALRATHSPETGAIDGVVAISRDMTERKDVELKLAALATSDSLTGLANRRLFDDRLKEEWARAQRDRTPLSLLMIDVDHFKRYNDHYGHQTGDSGLKALSAILAQEAHRPADLPARYGGEEFVMLLPGTDPEGCEMVGRRIREALHQLSWPHVLNEPSKILTASIGAATAWPGVEAAECATLIAAADAAMYAAKERGRDQVATALRAMELPDGRRASAMSASNGASLS